MTGGPGYNAAKVIAEDLDIRPRWRPRDLEEHLDGLS
jgi:hypothetical protein